MSDIISEKTIDSDFANKIFELSGQDIFACMQCGTCSGSCPMHESMNVSPRKIINYAKLGLKNKLLNLNSYWICATCYTCSVRCPRGIDIAKVMEALRQVILRTDKNFIEPSQVPDKILKDYPQIAMVASFRKMTS